jgi:hypothetical protein
MVGDEGVRWISMLPVLTEISLCTIANLFRVESGWQ